MVSGTYATPVISFSEQYLDMDCNLFEFSQANAFIDDILVVTKGTEIDHIGTVEKILKKIDEEIISLKLMKVNFFQRECEWLGHRITPTGVTPLITEPMEALKPPRTLSQLKKFTGSIHSLHRYLPASAKSLAKKRPHLDNGMPRRFRKFIETSCIYR